MTSGPPWTVLPSFVAQHWLAVPAATAHPERLFPDIPLPTSLARAVPKRRLEFLSGRRCAVLAMRRCRPETPAAPPAIGRHREPCWPPGLVGSITHTDRLAWAAVARADQADGLGIDCEPVVAAETAREIQSSIAAPHELEALCAAGLPSTEGLTLAFSAKEALFKCLYPIARCYFEYRDAEIAAPPPAAGLVRLRLLRDLGVLLAAGRELVGRFEIREGHVFTAFVYNHLNPSASNRRGPR
jgi:enterobactin synthetase component D